MPHADRFYQALLDVAEDLPVAEFLETRFAEPQYDELRRWVIRTVEGYDAADPNRFSTLALREEWLARDDGEHGRIREGYGALIAYLAAECRQYGAAIRLGAVVTAIERGRRRDRRALRRRGRRRGRCRDPCRAAAAAVGNCASANGARADRGRRAISGSATW